MTPALGGTWRKSSYSGGTGGDCVEVQRSESVTNVRDSKAPNSGMLSFAVTSATAFLTAVKGGRFDR